MLFVLCGCTTFLRYTNPSMQIEKGMNLDAVVKLMGEPQYRSFIDNSEEWVYERPISTDVDIKMIVVTFVNGKVHELNSFPQMKHHLQQHPPIYINTNRPHSSDEKIVAMDNATFETLQSSVSKKPFKDDKLELLKVGLSDRYLTCNQCIKLMSIFTFDDEKLNVLRMVGSKITDKENSTKIVDSLSFISSQTEAKTIIGR